MWCGLWICRTAPMWPIEATTGWPSWRPTSAAPFRIVCTPVLLLCWMFLLLLFFLFLFWSFYMSSTPFRIVCTSFASVECFLLFLLEGGVVLVILYVSCSIQNYMLLTLFIVLLFVIVVVFFRNYVDCSIQNRMCTFISWKSIWMCALSCACCCCAFVRVLVSCGCAFCGCFIFVLRCCCFCTHHTNICFCTHTANCVRGSQPSAVFAIFFTIFVFGQSIIITLLFGSNLELFTNFWNVIRGKVSSFIYQATT